MKVTLAERSGGRALVRAIRSELSAAGSDSNRETARPPDSCAALRFEMKAAPSMLREFRSYIYANGAFIPNYGDRWRHGEAISTAFVVKQIVSRRFVKKQQMRWTERGSHHLLQIRTRVLNDEWRLTMARWNPGMGVAA